MRPPSFGLVILMPLVLLACWGCDDDQDLDGGARLNLEVSHLDLGTVEAGRNTTTELTVSNAGDTTLYIGDVRVDGPPVFDVDWSGDVVPVPSGESVTFTVTFEPQTDKIYEATLIFDSNDARDPTADASLTGVGVAPVIRLSYTTYDFGDDEVGCDKKVDIALRNVGSMDLIVEEIVFSPTSDELLTSFDFPYGTKLAPQQGGTITIHYSPEDDRPDIGYLHVYSNDLLTPDALAVQTGTAHYSDVVVDEFEQYDERTDILWVIDTSGSMQDEWPQLVINFASLIDILEALGVDYQIAAISTLIPFFNGDVPIITKNTADPSAAFIDAMTMDEGGSHGTGLAMPLHALTPPQYEAGSVNYGFLRDYATLQIVFMSDQDDWSVDTVAAYVSQLQALKLNQDWVMLHGVTGQLSGCSSQWGDAQPGPRYEQAIAMTGGVSESLCAQYWIESIFNSESTSHPINNLGLSQTPVEDTIEVAMNGVLTHAGWSYDAEHNSVVFEPGHAPNVGDVTTITYNELGSCM